MNSKKTISSVLLFFILITGLVSAGPTPKPIVEAYYTRIESGEAFERVSRTGPYADISIDLDKGSLVFWHGSSYLPYWKTDHGRWYVDELIPRSGDGPAGRPDRTNTYSRVAIIESTPERAVVYWRYLPTFSGAHPHHGFDATNFVEEYFVVEADGQVTRTIRQGTEKVDDWRDPENVATQSFRLIADGIEITGFQEPRSSSIVEAVKGAPLKSPAQGNPVAWWRLDEGSGDATTEEIANISSYIEGHKSLWKKGVSGTALQFDGYTSSVTITGDHAPEINDAITLEGWVAIGAYPWNWAPIVQQCDDLDEVVIPVSLSHAIEKEPNDIGYFLGINGLGYPGLKLRIGDTWEELVSDTHLELRRWYHIVGTYDKGTGEMTLYVDGQPAGNKTVKKQSIITSDKDIRIGKGKPRTPINAVRPAFTFIDSYSFDGLIDEVKIHDVALSQPEVAQYYDVLKPDENEVGAPDMDTRALPSGSDTNEFGAYYTHLKFYESWDNLWRFGNHPDVVVEFDESPAKFVFWRGTGYVPMLVNEKGQWYTNEFNETWGTSGGRGCQEPMSDKESYSNHARIIENTPARAVVHWRYPLVDVHHVLANYDYLTGWGDWSDWYFYIYPDGVAAKRMHLWTSGLRIHEWGEVMAILGPGQHPEQVLETEPSLLFADLEGDVDTYDWVNGPPLKVKYKNKKIQMVNYKADYKPFTIADFTGGFVYSGELTPYSVFPSWNHWPVAQMPSDGRNASFPDRTSHSSLIHHVNMPTSQKSYGLKPFQEKILLEGMTAKSPDELVPLAKSWLNAPVLNLTYGGISQGYDPAQRAYIIAAEGGNLSFELQASEDSPVVNPCFVISNWGDAEVEIEINSKRMESGKDLRIGRPRTVKSHDLVIWARLESASPVRIDISR